MQKQHTLDLLLLISILTTIVGCWMFYCWATGITISDNFFISPAWLAICALAMTASLALMIALLVDCARARDKVGLVISIIALAIINPAISWIFYLVRHRRQMLKRAKD